MTHYVILPNGAAARGLSHTIGRLARALTDRPAHALADDAFRVIEHPDGRAALVIPGGWTFATTPRLRAQMDDPVDEERLKAAMSEYAPPVLVDGLATLAQMQIAFRGAASINMDDMLAFLNPALVRTQAQMEADGWFPAPVMT